MCVLVWLSPSSLLEMAEAVGRQPLLQVHLRHRIHHPCLVCLSLLQNCSSSKGSDKKYVLKETFFISCWIFVSLFQISVQLSRQLSKLSFLALMSGHRCRHCQLTADSEHYNYYRRKNCFFIPKNQTG